MGQDEAVKPSPEMEVLVKRFTDAVTETTRTENRRLLERIEVKIDQLRDDLERKIERVRGELREEITAVRQDQALQAAKLEEHGEMLGRMEVRLEAGDRKFDSHECRIRELEKKETDNRVGIAKLAATAGKLLIGPGVAAAVAAGVCSMLQSRAEPAPKIEPHPTVQTKRE